MNISNGIGSVSGLSNGVTNQPTHVSQTAATGKDQQAGVTAVPVHPVPRVNQDADQAVISSTSGLLSQALSVSDVRLNKTLPLQQAIASGSYSVSSSDVANAIIDTLS